MPLRAGIANVVIVGILVIVITVAGVGVYVFVFAVPGASGNKTTTFTIGTTSSSRSTGGTQGYLNYQGTFTYENPLGPFGINDSSGKPVEWNSTQSATGTFTFSINPANYSGTGRGQGSITVTTHGYCTGSVTVQYTFTITANNILGGNITVGFNTPNPSSAMVQLTCQGSTMGFNQANNPITFLSVYPNLVSVHSAPAMVTMVPTAGISYTVTLAQTS